MVPVDLDVVHNSIEPFVSPASTDSLACAEQVQQVVVLLDNLFLHKLTQLGHVLFRGEPPRFT